MRANNKKLFIEQGHPLFSSLRVIICSLFLCIAATANVAADHPFDGMSAIDIEIAALSNHSGTSPELFSGDCDSDTSTDGLITLSQFQFVELKGRPVHEAYLPLPGQPVPGMTMVKALLWGPWKTVQFRFLNESMELIENIGVVVADPDVSPIYFYGEVTIPNIPFYASVSGTDTDDTPFDIICAHLFSPQTVEVRFKPEFQTVLPGVIELEAMITNHGPADTFTLVATNDLDLEVSASAPQVALEPEESISVTVFVTMPAISDGLLDAISKLTATGTINSSNHNFATSVTRTERFDLIFTDGFNPVELPEVQQ